MCLLYDAIVVFSGLKIGSGFTWDDMGHIVTNCHVIKDASDFRLVHFFLFISLFINSLFFWSFVHYVIVVKMGFFFVRSPKLWRVEKTRSATYISLLFVVLFMDRVTIFDGIAYDAKVVGYCKNKDVVVLHVEELKGKVKPIRICPFANLLVGQSVFAIGSPVSMSF